MSFLAKSLLELSSLKHDEVKSLFDLALKIELKGWSILPKKNDALISLVFLEPSTRTVSSFEIAALRSGYKVSTLNGDFSSVKKGETLLDTLLTLDSMRPDLFVVRHGNAEKLSDIVPQLKVPVINAGEGVAGHPTQGLLDAYTIIKERKTIEEQKVLIIGDITHSRVAASNIELLNKLGAQIAVCGPEEWAPSHFKKFESLKEGLEWATVCMALRIQKERHSSESKNLEVRVQQNFQLNKNSLKNFRSDGLILHPGPFNRDVELTSDVLHDSRCGIWKQTENGVYIRAALMAQILGAA